MAQRSGQRRERRGVLPARRGERPLLVADAAALRRRRRPTSRATASATASSSTPRTASRSELRVYVALDAPVKFSVLKVRNARAGRAGSRPPATSNGCWATCGRKRRCTSSPRSIRRAARCFARNAYNTEFADRVAFFDVDDATRTRERRPHRVPRPQRHAAAIRPRCARARSRTGSARRSIPARALQVPFELADGRSARSSSRSASARGATTPATWCSASRLGAARARSRRSSSYWKRTLGAVQVETPDASLERAGQRLAPVPDARLPPVGAQRLLPVGRRVRLPRPAAGRRWRWSTPSRASCASTCCAARRASSAKATCSTGGIRRRAAACARIARTTTCGCRWRRAATSPRTGDTGVLDEPVPFLEGRPVNPEDDSYYDLPRAPSEAASLYEHCVRAIEHGLRIRRARPAADGLRRLERRHEPGRRRAARAKASGSAFFLYDVLMRFAKLRACAGDAAFAERCQREAARLRAQHRAARLGRRVVPARVLRRRHAAGLGEQPECQIDSICAELVGAVRRRRHRSARSRRWTRWTSAWCAATTG